MVAGPIAELLADLPLVDGHCHPLLGGSLDAAASYNEGYIFGGGLGYGMILTSNPIARLLFATAVPLAEIAVNLAFRSAISASLHSVTGPPCRRPG